MRRNNKEKESEIIKKGQKTGLFRQENSVVEALLGRGAVRKEPVELSAFLNGIADYIRDFVDAAVSFPEMQPFYTEIFPEGAVAALMLIYVGLRTRYAAFRITAEAKAESYALIFCAHPEKKQSGRAKSKKQWKSDEKELSWAMEIAEKCGFSVALGQEGESVCAEVTFPRYRVGGMVQSGVADYSRFISSTAAYVLQVLFLLDDVRLEQSE